MTIESLEIESNLQIGEIIPSIEAVDWVNGHRNVDIRPRLVDSSSGEARLLDSGAQLSATQRRPEDKLDNSVNLVAVNGSRIPTYGIRKLVVKIGRKSYDISAIICDVNLSRHSKSPTTHHILSLSFEFDGFI